MAKFQLSYLKSWKMMCAVLNLPANLEDSAVATGLENVSFHSNSKERQCQRMFKLCTIALMSHTSKVMLKILQARLTWIVNLKMFKLDLEKAEEPEIKIHWIIEKAREFQKNIYCFIDYAKAFDCVDHNKLQKILREMGIPDHLTFLLRNLYASQEATVRTGHGTTDWFQIGKGVCQGCILSPCLFNLLGWKEHKLESRLLGEISIISDMQMTPPLWQKVKRN